MNRSICAGVLDALSDRLSDRLSDALRDRLSHGLRDRSGGDSPGARRPRAQGRPRP